MNHSAKRLVRFTDEYKALRAYLLDDTIRYGIDCMKKWGTIMPRYSGRVYDQFNDQYLSFMYEPVPLNTEQAQKDAFGNMLRARYSIGHPLIMTAFIFPLIITNARNENLVAICVFMETEFTAHNAIYLYENENLVYNKELTSRTRFSPDIERLARLLTIVPEMN